MLFFRTLFGWMTATGLFPSYTIWSFFIFLLFDCNSLFLEFMSSALLNPY